MLGHDQTSFSGEAIPARVRHHNGANGRFKGYILAYLAARAAMAVESRAINKKPEIGRLAR
jgi:hypothetical protein